MGKSGQERCITPASVDKKTAVRFFATELNVSNVMVRSHIIVYTNVTSSFTLLSYDFLQTKGGNHDLDGDDEDGAENRVY